MTNAISGTDIYLQYQWRYTRDDFKFCPRCGHGLVQQPLHIPDEPQLVCHNCRFILYLDPKLVATAVVTHESGAVLLLKRSEAPGIGKWALPGGHIQRGEDPRETIVAEIMQEASLTTRVKRFVDFYTTKEHGVIQLVFECSADTTVVRPNIESSEARFFSRTEIPWDELAFESTGNALEAVGCVS